MISSNPTAEEKAQYSTWLVEAEAAYHKLMTGVSAASASYNGESVSYTQASKPQLLNYIGSLRKALGKSGLSNKPVSFRHPVFGRRS